MLIKILFFSLVPYFTLIYSSPNRKYVILPFILVLTLVIILFNLLGLGGYLIYYLILNLLLIKRYNYRETESKFKLKMTRDYLK